MGEEAELSEARCHPDWVGVYATGMWGEGDAFYPGRSTRLPGRHLPASGQVGSEGTMRGESKSAEVIVAAGARQ